MSGEKKSNKSEEDGHSIHKRGNVKVRVADWEDDHDGREMKFEALCNMSKKEIQSITKIPTRGGRYVLSARGSYIDLASYNMDSDRYINDLKVLLSDIKYIITNEDYEDTFVKFAYTKGKRSRAMTHIHFTFNMIMWRGFFSLGIPVDHTMVFMPVTFSNKEYQDFINKKLIEPYKHLTTHSEMSSILCSMYDDYIWLCENVGRLLGLTYSLHEVLSQANVNPELYDIIHTELSPDMHLSDVEDYIESQSKRIVEIFLTDEGFEKSSIKAFIEAGVLNKKQIRECYVNIGLKPDLAGNTIPITNNTNFVTNGLRDLPAYVVDALGARKAAVLALSIADGGYFSRLAIKLASGITTHDDPDYDCGSEHYYKMEIKSATELQTMHGRWYLSEINTLRQLIETDYELIGQTLLFRTPSTCACGGDSICSTCYGHLFNQNHLINIGALASLKIGEKNYQAVMGGLRPMCG